MAKEKVLCPFSNKLCEECALYRGRHYYLCYHPAYRGYLGGKRKHSRPIGARNNGGFEIPEIKVKAMDPYLKIKEDEAWKER